MNTLFSRILHLGDISINPTLKEKVLHWITHLIPYAILLAVPVGFIFAILLQKVSFALYGLIIGVPTFAAVLFILKIQKRDSDFTGRCVLFLFNQQFLLRIFFIIFSISFIVILLFSTKSTLCLIFISFLYCIILIQIFSKNQSPWIIITEIVLTQIILIYTTTLTSPYYFGSTDIISHDFFASITASTGHILPPELSEYSYFPLYHLWIASGSLITSFNSYTTIMVLTCPVFAISAVMVYFIFNRIIMNQQIALLTCLLYSSSSVVVFYGTYVVTRTMAFIGFVFLLYLLYKSKVNENEDQELIFKSLAIIFVVYITLVHQVSTPMILILLIILLLCDWFFTQKKYISSNFIFFSALFFIAYWLYYSYSFTYSVITTRLNPENFDTLLLLQYPSQNIPFFASAVFFINKLHMLIFIFFGIIGIFYIIWRNKSTYTLVFGLFSLITIVLYIPSPLQTLWQTVQLLRFERFQLFIAPFMALMMAWGICVVLKYFEQKKIPIKIMSFFTLVFLLIFFCSSIGLLYYNELPSTRVSFNKDELIGYNFIEKYIPSESYILSDYYSSRYWGQFNYRIGRDITRLSLNQGYFVIPKRQFLTNGLDFYGGSELNPEGGKYSYPPTDENIRTLDWGLYSKDQIYSSNSLEVYFS